MKTLERIIMMIMYVLNLSFLFMSEYQVKILSPSTINAAPLTMTQIEIICFVATTDTHEIHLI